MLRNQPTIMDDEEYLQPVLISQEEPEEFQKLDTIQIVLLPLIFGVITIFISIFLFLLLYDTILYNSKILNLFFLTIFAIYKLTD